MGQRKASKRSFCAEKLRVGGHFCLLPACRQSLQICSLECHLGLPASHCAASRASFLTQLWVRLPRACYLLHLYFAKESEEHLPDQIAQFVTYSRAVVWLHPQPGRGASKLCPLLGERLPFSPITGPVAVGVGRRAGSGLTGHWPAVETARWSTQCRHSRRHRSPHCQV